MIPILRAHPEDKTRAQLVWDGKIYDLSTAKAVQWMDVLYGPVMTAACENAKKAPGPVKVEGWGIFGQ